MSPIEIERGWEAELDVDIYKTEIEPHLTADGRVFVVAGYDLHVFDADDGSIVRRLDPELGPTITSPIAVDEEACYLPISWGIPDDSGEMWAFEHRTGTMRWENVVDVSVNAGTVENDGTVFVGRGSDPLALDADTGRVAWIFDDTDHWFDERAAIAADDDQFYIAAQYSGADTRSGEVLALDVGSGNLQWRTANHSDSYEPYYHCLHLASGDGILAVTQYDEDDRTGRVRGLDPATGEERWRWSDDSSFRPISMTVAEQPGVVCVSSDSETVGIDAADGEERWRYGASGRDLVPAGEFLFVANGRSVQVLDATGGIAYETLEPNGDQVRSIDWLDGSLYYVTTGVRTNVGAFETDYESGSPGTESNDEATDDAACPDCGTDLTGDEAFCPACGHDLSEDTGCPSCGADLDGDEAFCPECGHELG